MSSFKIPLSDLDYGPEEEFAVLNVLKSKWISMGSETQSFEAEFSKMVQTQCAICVSNATAGLHLALIAVGVRPGDEVIQPALNFVASANMTIACGAKPVFADIISLNEPTLDPTQVERLITPRTKAVIAMHYGGYLCRMDELVSICKSRGIALIEDACHAVGAYYESNSGPASRRQMAGGIGDIGVFSFFSNKNLAVGEGGMIVTESAELGARCRQLRSHGMTTLSWDRHQGHARSYDVTDHGYNYRIDDLRAALGRCQLRKLAAGNLRRRELVAQYRQNLAPLHDWISPFASYTGDSAFHLMPLLAPNTAARDNVTAALSRDGVQTSMHYPCISDFSAFSAYATSDLPQSVEFSKREMTLPLFPGLSPNEVDFICDTIIESV